MARLYEAKGRPRFNPLIAHVTDLAMARRVARLDERARRLAEAFWPGPLTLVAPVSDSGLVCDLARAGLDTVAVRAPDHPVGAGGDRRVRPADRRALGQPLRPSEPHDASPTRSLETGAAAAVALDGGPCRIGLESTVVSLLDGPPRLLRPGAVTRGEIERLIGPLAEAEADAARSPGRLARHYAPAAPLRLEADAPREGEAYLAFGPAPQSPRTFSLSPTRDLAEAASRLFSALRAADALTPAAIAVAPIPDDGLGEAINDRLRRAAGYVG